MSDALLVALEADLRSLVGEARKGEGISLSGLFSSSQLPAIREAAERAADTLNLLSKQPDSAASVLSSSDVLRPFLLTCESQAGKNSRLVLLALGALQKVLAAAEALAPALLSDIITAIETVERSPDDAVRLRILQIVLTFLQRRPLAEQQEPTAQLLGLAFRIHAASRQSTAVLNTAGAALRQAVAAIFDYAVQPSAGSAAGGDAAAAAMPPGAPPGAPVRQLIALHLLSDIVLIAAGSKAAWLKAPATVSRGLLLELLEALLLQRAAAFRAIPAFTQCLQDKVCHLVEGLARSALDPDVDVSYIGDCRLVLRIVGALAAGYAPLVGRQVAAMLSLLCAAAAPGSRCMEWQRLWSLDVLRRLTAQPAVLHDYMLMYDMQPQQQQQQGGSGGGGLRVVAGLATLLQEVVASLLRAAAAERPSPSAPDGSADGCMALLSALHAQSAADPRWSLNLDGAPAMGASAAEAHAAYLALEALAGLASSLCTLAQCAVGGAAGVALAAAADAVAEQLGRPSSQGKAGPAGGGDAGGAQGAAAGAAAPGEVQLEAVRRAAEVCSRPILAAVGNVAARSDALPLVLSCLGTLSSLTLSLGCLGLVPARDACLRALCELALAPPAEAPAVPDAAPAAAASAGRQGSDAVTAGAGASVATARGEPPYQLSSSGSSLVTLEPTRSGTLAGPPADGKLGLSPSAMNLAALRALLSISSSLAESLGGSWAAVVAVVDHLDCQLMLPSRLQLEQLAGAEQPGGNGVELQRGGSSDRLGLAAAISQLFESSAGMSTDAAVSLLSALGEASLKALPAQPISPAQPRLCALSRMADVLMANLHRIQDLWALFLTHTMELLASGSPPVVEAALAALERILIAALGPRQTPRQSGSGLAAAGSGGSTDDAGGVRGGRGSDGSGSSRRSSMENSVEHMLLVALESLFLHEAAAEAQRGLLRIAHQVLQRHGEALERGWAPLLRLLAAAAGPGAHDASVVSAGFQCVSLVCSDLLVAMPAEHLARALEVVGMYAQQGVAVNIGLTAVALLWSASDLLGHSVASGSAAATAAGAGAGSGGGSSRALASGTGRTDLDEEGSAELLMKVFRLLRACSGDARPEVRNSGVRTLFQAVASHGGRLSRAAWRQALFDLLLPSLKHLHHMSATGSTEVANSGEVAKGVPLLVHHSRNTEQKQWDDTLAVGLQGLAKVLRGHLPLLLQLEGFRDAWGEMMEVVAASLASGRKALTMPASALLLTAVQVQTQPPPPAGNSMPGSSGSGSGAAPPVWLWKRVLSALDSGVDAMASPSSGSPLPARLDFMDALAAVHAALRPQLEEADYVLLQGWVRRFGCFPTGADDSAVHGGALPPVQKKLLDLIPQLLPSQAPAMWPQAVATLCDFLCPLQLWCHAHGNLLPPAAQHDAAATQHGAASEDAVPMPSPSGPSSARITASSLVSLFAPPATPSAPAAPRPRDSSSDGATASNAARLLMGLDEAQQRAAATALSAPFMLAVVQLLCGVYKESLPSSAKVATFTAVTSALTQCMTMRHAPGGTGAGGGGGSSAMEALWMGAAAAFVQVVEAGLPALVVAHHGRKGEPAHPEAWEALARAFEAYFHAMRLPFPPQAAEEEEGKAAAEPAAAQAAAGRLGELDAQVLETLVERVLTCCMHAPPHIRKRLAQAVESLAARPRPYQQHLPVNARLSALALQKLRTMCERGTALQGSNHCLLDVAQMALPLFLQRCERLLRAYVDDAQLAGAGANGLPAARNEELLHVLRLLFSTSLEPIVMDRAGRVFPALRPWIKLIRSRDNADEAQREQTHILAFYELLCELAACIREPGVRQEVTQRLLLLGQLVGLTAGGAVPDS